MVRQRATIGTIVLILNGDRTPAPAVIVAAPTDDYRGEPLLTIRNLTTGGTYRNIPHQAVADGSPHRMTWLRCEELPTLTNETATHGPTWYPATNRTRQPPAPTNNGATTNTATPSTDQPPHIDPAWHHQHPAQHHIHAWVNHPHH